jgi:hypothetical protein
MRGVCSVSIYGCPSLIRRAILSEQLPGNPGIEGETPMLRRRELIQASAGAIAAIGLPRAARAAAPDCYGFVSKGVW